MECPAPDTERHMDRQIREEAVGQGRGLGMTGCAGRKHPQGAV